MPLPVLSVILAALSLVITIIGGIYIVGVRMGRLDVKVETMWDFLLRRAAAEGVSRGMLTVNSPLKIKPEALQLLETLKPQLQEFYQKCGGPKITEHDLAREIEKNFGATLVKDFCIPNDINLGTCLLIAVGVAKGVDTLDTILTHVAETVCPPEAPPAK